MHTPQRHLQVHTPIMTKGSQLFTLAGSQILSASPKRIALSGPSGFLGTKVLDSILDIFLYRHENNVEPGKIVLLTSSPGRLMKRLSKSYGPNKMQFIRASRVNFFTQHSTDMWTDNLASLGFVDSAGLVFVNLAAIAGPLRETGDRAVKEPTSRQESDSDSMMDVNYHAVAGAAKACEALGFEHFIQSSSQAVNVERAGQVFYSRGKAMADAMLLQRTLIPATTIVRLGLLYCQENSSLGQDGNKLNLVDLAKLPLTPILGNGLAPLQPMERMDAAERLAFLATTDPQDRPPDMQPQVKTYPKATPSSPTPKEVARSTRVRVYDAVGPETLTMKELLQVLAIFQGRTLTPVHVGYQNMERLLNVASLGNYNRQFVSILRSEQDFETQAKATVPVGTMSESAVAFQTLLHREATLRKFQDVFASSKKGHKRVFPVSSTLKWVYRNPGVVQPGIALGLEILRNYCVPSYQAPYLAAEKAAIGRRENAPPPGNAQ